MASTETMIVAFGDAGSVLVTKGTETIIEGARDITSGTETMIKCL